MWTNTNSILENKIRREERKIRKDAVQVAREKFLEIGIKKGEIKGKEEGEKEMAKALKENGVAVAIIAKSSGLSKKQIQKL